MALDGDEKMASAMSKVSIADGESVNETKIDRHCGFCLTLIPGEKVRHCGGCKRRAYCSRECQKADWKITIDKPAYNGRIYAYGQGHKNWCGILCGEEDLDWKVVGNATDGFGLVALRDLPPFYRIIVEATQHSEEYPCHPALEDIKATKAGCFRGRRGAEVDGLVGLRTIHAGHKCDANADFDDIEDLNVMVMLSQREIKAGEAITTQFVGYNNLSFFLMQIQRDGLSVDEFLDGTICQSLAAMDIICPPNCVCREKRTKELLQLCGEVFHSDDGGGKKMSLKKHEKIMEIAKELNCPTSVLACLNHGAYAWAVGCSENLGKAKGFLEEVIHLYKISHPPESKALKDYENILQDLTKSPWNFKNVRENTK